MDTTNEPVAWINLEAWESGKYPPDDCFSDEEFTGSIPLYAHPVKELTHEEILPIYTEYSSYYDDQRLFVDIYGFARAILRKAQEK